MLFEMDLQNMEAPLMGLGCYSDTALGFTVLQHIDVFIKQKYGALCIQFQNGYTHHESDTLESNSVLSHTQCVT